MQAEAAATFDDLLGSAPSAGAQWVTDRLRAGSGPMAERTSRTVTIPRRSARDGRSGASGVRRSPRSAAGGCRCRRRLRALNRLTLRGAGRSRRRTGRVSSTSTGRCSSELPDHRRPAAGLRPVGAPGLQRLGGQRAWRADGARTRAPHLREVVGGPWSTSRSREELRRRRTQAEHRLARTARRSCTNVPERGLASTASEAPRRGRAGPLNPGLVPRNWKTAVASLHRVSVTDGSQANGIHQRWDPAAERFGIHLVRLAAAARINAPPCSSRASRRRWSVRSVCA